MRRTMKRMKRGNEREGLKELGNGSVKEGEEEEVRRVKGLV